MKRQKLLAIVAATAVLLLGTVAGTTTAQAPDAWIATNAVGAANTDDAVSPAGAPGAAPDASSFTLLADADATIKVGSPDGNFGGADTLDLEYAGGGRAISCILLHFNLSASLPSGTNIDSAQLQVRLNSGTGVSPVTVYAYTVNEEWGELNVTWNTGPEIVDPIVDAQVGTTQGWVTWDVTTIARVWQSARNYGLELCGPASGEDWYRTFRSRHPGEAEPRLVVTYSYTETTPPSNPISFTTADHFVNQWSNLASISGHWDGASDGGGSGVYGYSIEWSASATTVPDAVVDTMTNQDTHALADGSWYLHVRTVDVAGNWNADASHFGPYKIDTALPANPTISSTSHTPGVWSVNPTVLVSWSGASDGAGSGVAGYSILWDAAASTEIDTSVDTAGSTASSTRPDGVTYFHLRTVDAAGNWTSTVHFGPLKIDATPPTNPDSFSADHFVNQWSNIALIGGTWDGASDGAGSGVYGYSIEWSASATTVPDAVVDTTTNQVTHSLANGSWYLHVRTVDVAGRWNAGASHFGPYKIDASPPTNPTISSTSHTSGDWSTNPTVLVSWSGASDGAGSGVAGYSIFWDAAASTVPPAAVNTTGGSASSSRPNGVTYFHLRTQDVAGNWTSPVHFGPLKIDTIAPGCAVAALPAYVGLAPFIVSWSGTDAGSGVASYDVQVQDGEGAWTNWRTATTSLYGVFTGVRGHTYAFRCRTRDVAGNLGVYPEGDEFTSVGRTLGVQVHYLGSPVAGALVYRNGELLGTTNAWGNLAAPGCVQGDNLAAHYAIYNQPSLKRPADPSWVVYATNVTIPLSGAPQLFVFGDVGASPDPVVIDVDGNRPLIGFRVVFSVEWDAPADYLDDLRKGAVLASQYLYDATDGQMFWEYVDIFDDRVGYDWTDYRVQLHNQTWPCGDVGGILDGAAGDHHIYIGREFGRGAFATLSWTNWDAYPTLDHEFGHYGLGLWDEYLKRDGTGGGSCATNFYSQPSASRSSMMYHEWETSELCSTVDSNHKHNTQTQHDFASGGESTWQTVLRRFADPAAVDRWTLQSPVERGQIVPGPDALPGNWVKSNIVNYNTGACAPFDEWISDGNGQPVQGVLVTLDRPGIDLVQGVTDANGYIAVYGAHNGETLLAQKDGASGSMAVSCSPGPAAVASPPGLTIASEPFALEVSTQAAGQDLLGIKVKASVALAEPPAVEVQQVAGSEPLPVTLTFDAGSGVYRGQAELPPAGGTQGYLRVAATDMAEHTIVRMVSFKLLSVPASESTTVRSADNVLRMTFPAGSLSGDTVVSIQETPEGAATQDELVRVGAAYAVTAASGQTDLNAPAAVLMYYPMGLSDVAPGTLRLHRWDTGTQKWVEYAGTVDTNLDLVSAQVSELGVFAILGQPASRSLYLPLVVRNQ